MSDGAPSIETLRRRRLRSLGEGVMNGTCNYLLSSGRRFGPSRGAGEARSWVSGSRPSADVMALCGGQTCRSSSAKRSGSGIPQLIASFVARFVPDAATEHWSAEGPEQVGRCTPPEDRRAAVQVCRCHSPTSRGARTRKPLPHHGSEGMCTRFSAGCRKMPTATSVFADVRPQRALMAAGRSGTQELELRNDQRRLPSRRHRARRAASLRGSTFSARRSTRPHVVTSCAKTAASAWKRSRLVSKLPDRPEENTALAPRCRDESRRIVSACACRRESVPLAAGRAAGGLRSGGAAAAKRGRRPLISTTAAASMASGVASDPPQWQVMADCSAASIRPAKSLPLGRAARAGRWLNRAHPDVKVETRMARSSVPQCR